MGRMSDILKQFPWYLYYLCMFMSAIEKITAKTGQIHIASSDEDGQEVTEVPVWNGNMAKLTLMALATLSQRGWDPALWWG